MIHIGVTERATSFVFKTGNFCLFIVYKPVRIKVGDLTWKRYGLVGFKCPNSQLPPIATGWGWLSAPETRIEIAADGNAANVLLKG